MSDSNKQFDNIKLGSTEKTFRGKSCLKHRLSKQKCPAECPGRVATQSKPELRRLLEPTPTFAVGVPVSIPDRIKCNNFPSGCEWEGPRADLQPHMLRCSFQLVPCKWNCNGLFYRQELSSHEDQCSLKGIICAACSLPIRIDHISKHECPMSLIPCRKCSLMIPRSNESQHIIQDCHLQLIKCIHGDKGCDAMVLRKDMQIHLKECIFDKIKIVFQRIESLEKQVKTQNEKLGDQEMRLRQQSLKIMNQEKVIKQQVDLIYDMRAKVHKEESGEEGITLFDPDTNTHSVLKVGKRKYKQKEKGGPKRSKSAFMYFCMDKRKEISLKNPSIRMVDMAKELSRMWSELKDKTPFESMAEMDRERYEREKREWLSSKLSNEGKSSSESLGKENSEMEEYNLAQEAQAVLEEVEPMNV